MRYEEALEQALQLRGDVDALEAFLTGVPEWEPRLRAALLVTQALTLEAAALRPSSSAMTRIEGGVLERVRTQASRESRSGVFGRIVGAWNSLPGPRIIVAAGTLGFTVALASLIALPLFQTSPSAQAVVIRGSVAEVGPSVLTVNQDGQASTIKLSTGASFTDGVGNVVDETALSPGQSIVLRGTRVGDEVIAESLEIEDHIFGVVQSISPDLLVITTSQGVYEIVLTAETETKGNIVPGAYVEVEVELRSDGRFVAHEIEVEDEDEGDDEGHDDEDSSSRGYEAPSPDVQPVAGQPPVTSGPVTAPTLTFDKTEESEGEDEDDSDGGGGFPGPSASPDAPATPSAGDDGEGDDKPEATESPEPTEAPEVQKAEDPEPAEDDEDVEPQQRDEQDETEGDLVGDGH